MREEEPINMEFGNDFLMDVGHTPDSEPPYPTVILHHGLTGNKSEVTEDSFDCHDSCAKKDASIQIRLPRTRR